MVLMLTFGIIDIMGVFTRKMPHKAVAEVSKIGNYRRGELL